MTPTSAPADFLSIVVPCYNESACLPLLLDRIDRALAQVPGCAYEVLVVDDGSRDETWRVLQECRQKRPYVAGLRLVRNFGHQAALIAGLRQAKGDAVICMDADLQHPPELLPQMIERWRKGSDVVQTLRRSQPGMSKTLSSRLFYFLFNFVSEVRVEDGAADFRLMSRRALDALLALPERSLFLRGMVAWLGFPSTTIEFNAAARAAGHSGYSFRAMRRFAMEGLLALSTRPLNLGFWIAGAGMLAAVLYALWITIAIQNGATVVKGWPSTIALILIMGSLNLLCTSIIGLYVRAILMESRKRPSFLVSEYIPASAISSGAAEEASSFAAGGMR